MKIKPPKGYYLLRGNSKPSRKLKDKYYDTVDYKWKLTSLSGQWTAKDMTFGNVGAYARKK